MRDRLHAICPYFAMFPEDFAHRQIALHTQADDWVLDPFSGRGTAPFQALLDGRRAAAIDINPVAFVITGAKTQPPTTSTVAARLQELEAAYGCSAQDWPAARRALPKFFGRAFYFSTLEQVLFLRASLHWRHSQVDRFIAALLLGTLQGEMGRSQRYLSNQLVRTISPKPAYSLRWWREHNLWPKKRDVFRRLHDESLFRLGRHAADHPARAGQAVVVHGDARAASKLLPALIGRTRLVLTSPPYLDTTSFEEDQWLRLWALGHDDHPTYRVVSKDDRRRGPDSYWQFLTEAWQGVAPLTAPNATVVVRIGGRAIGPDALVEGLSASVRVAFPEAVLSHPPEVSLTRKRQTNAFRPGSAGNGFEVDVTFRTGTRRRLESY